MKIVVSILTGFLLGALIMVLAHPPQRINAQQVNANTQLHIHVSEVPKGGEIDMKGSHTVGFSCFDAYGHSSANYRCFIATAE